jgi:hypothetical protein
MRWAEQEARTVYGTELDAVESDSRSWQGWGLKAARGADETNFRAPILPRGDSVPSINIQLRPLRPFSKRLPLFVSSVFPSLAQQTLLHYVTFAICTVSPARSGPDSDGYYLPLVGDGQLPLCVAL